MGAHHIRGLWAALLVLVISLGIPDPAAAYDNPDLLPDHPTPVIDLAKIFSDQQRASLEDSLNTVENETGWKLRVLTQYEQTPGLAVREFWGLDESSLLVVADPRGGNILNFNVGDAFFAMMPRTYWVELQTRFGNQYYVKDNGEDGAVLDALNAVEICLERGGCQVVPGLPLEQWLWTLTTSILGGVIAGFAASLQRGRNDCLVLAAAAHPVDHVVRCLRHCPVVTRTPELPVDPQRSWLYGRSRRGLPDRADDGRSAPQQGQRGLTAELRAGLRRQCVTQCKPQEVQGFGPTQHDAHRATDAAP